MISNESFSKVKYYLLFLILVISFYRSPFIFLNGRFAAEEATQHLLSALNNSFIGNFLFYDDLAGYYNILPNILLELSTLLPLEHSPYITVYGSFFFIFLIPYFCLNRESILLNNNTKKILSSFILFLAPPFVPEIWLNSINLQVYMCLIAILIFFMSNLTFVQMKINNILIFLGSLSGIYTCALFPVYFVKYIYNKNNYNLINCLILFFSSIIQISLIIYSKINEKLVSSVLVNDFTLDTVVYFFYNIILKPIFGRQVIHYFMNQLNLIEGTIIYLVLFLIIIFAIVLLANIKMVINFLRNDYIFSILLSIFALISFVILVGSINNQLGGRYAVIPGSILLLIILHLSFEIKKPVIKILFFLIISFSLIFGANEFRPPTENVKHQYIKYLDCINCPIWKEEIYKWRKNNEYEIGIWPYPRKKLKLKIN